MLTSIGFHYGGTPAVLISCLELTHHDTTLGIAVRMAALGRLAGGVAHDFNNLLLVVGGHVARLQTALPPGHELRQAADAIASEAERAARLTDHLLSFGRGQMLMPEALDIDAFIDDLTPQLRAALGPSIDVRVERGSALDPVCADRMRLREILWHLVENARDAMPDGGSLTLTLDSVQVDERLHARWAYLPAGRHFVRLRLIDSGTGMASDVVPHIFEPFFTTKGRGRGAGLGLASVYGLVKQSAGYVFVEQTGRHGTSMVVLLPPAQSGDVPLRPIPAAASSPAPRPRQSILLVEDDPGVRELLFDVLSIQGFDVRAAETAEEAEEYATGMHIDLLLSDIDLPGISGAELAARLIAQHPAIRVILMSGYPDDGAIERAGVRERPMLLRKPFAMPVLLDKVRAVLAGASAPDE
jgi:nitrogen-specific signal transduction histidine kinase